MTENPRTRVELADGPDGSQVLLVTSPDGSTTRHPLVAGDDPVGLRSELASLGYSYSPPAGELKAAAQRDFWEAVEAAAETEIAAMAKIPGNRGFYDQDTGQPLVPGDIVEMRFTADSWDNGWFLYSNGELSTPREIAGSFDYPKSHEHHRYGLELRIPAIDDGDLSEQILVLTDRTELSERFDWLTLTRPDGYVAPSLAAVLAAENGDDEDDPEQD